MCKLAYVRTKDNTAYQRCIDMIKFQEKVVAGQSTGITWKDSQGFHTRKAIGKINSFLAKFPDTPTNSNEALGHSRFASVGEVSIANQHPIPIIVNGVKIGYGIHNGTWFEYVNYEYMRSDIENKTDSALLFTMYGKMLDKIGDTAANRRVAFGYIMSLLSYTRNLVIMFKNGQVLFSGNGLTYRQGQDSIGIMSFGFPDNCDDKIIYEIKGYTINKFQTLQPPFKFEPRPPKPKPVPVSKQSFLPVVDYDDMNIEDIPGWDESMKDWEREMRD